MLRLTVIALLLANAGYYAWASGQLQGWGLGPSSDAEPQRLGQQIAPDKLRVLPPPDAAAPAASGPPPDAAAAPATPAASDTAAATAAADAPDAPTAPATAAPQAGVCLQAGVFDTRQAEALRAALAGWPEGSWELRPTPLPGRWMVYMGRFADEEALARKRAELRALKVDYDRPGAALEPGLSLGRFSTPEIAQRGLTQLAAQGVRTARVVQERAETPAFTLRLPALTPAQRPQLAGLQKALAGKELRPCSTPGE